MLWSLRSSGNKLINCFKPSSRLHHTPTNFIMESKTCSLVESSVTVVKDAPVIKPLSLVHEKIPDNTEKTPSKKRKASVETRKKQSEAHTGAKHHCFGVACPDETKAKISRTLSSITRLDFDGVTPLPQHMKTLNDAGDVGYMIVAHAALSKTSKIKFSSQRSNSEGNPGVLVLLRAKCGFYLSHLNECEATHTTPTVKNIYMKGFLMA